MRYIFTIIIALVLFSGCGPQTTKTNIAVDPTEKAKQLIADEDYLAAAEEYFRLAKTDKKRAGLYQLRATDALLSANELERAEQIVNAVKPKKNDPQTSYLKLVLQGKIQLYKNNPKQALKLLAQEPVAETPIDMLAQTYLIRAQSYELLSQYLAAVRERLNYQNYIDNQDALRRNTDGIWSSLNKLDDTTLNSLRSNSTTELKSWADLALINKTLLTNPTVLKKSLLSWQEAYPTHPGIPHITDKLLQLSQQYGLQPQQIALLLPLVGQYQKATEAVRDGFLSAWYNNEEYRPTIKIYNANSINIRESYNKAVSEGADFIVGPLEKQAIINLTKSGSLPVVTLALNQADITTENNTGLLPSLIQFGLSPEDEARQAAERSFFDGHNKALVLTPNNDWGKRIATSFKQTWQETGGRVLEDISFETNDGDLASPVKQLLNVDSSERRATKLRQMINRRLESEARLRHDADMIFLAAPPLYARQLVPQFRFHKAESIPIYSTSHMFSGVVNPEIDADMDGVKFTDIPWILSDDTDSNVIKNVVNRNWQAEKSPYRRLYALGIDTFNLIPHLSKLAFESSATYTGETGILSMTEDGRIQRRLLWGTIQRGRPFLLSD